jgi:hypothetical protein
MLMPLPVPKRPWLALLGLLAACGGPTEDATMRTNPANRKPGYFDVKGFLDAQVAQLSQQQPAVEKQVQLRNGQTETTRVVKTDWSKELQIFYQADINKPALRGAYEVTNINSKQQYLRKPGTDASVVALAVGTSSNQPKAAPETLAAVIQQDNALFYSEKKLLLTMRNGQLTEYEVYGVQKLAFFDTVRYSVRTRVVQ